MFLHLVLYMRNLRSLAAKPASVVATLAFAMGFRWALRRKRCINPRNKGPRFLCLVARAAPTSCTVIELLLPSATGDLVELFKENLINWKTPPLFETAYGALFNDLVVSGQRPLGVAHV
jgi:hypothetical protein